MNSSSLLGGIRGFNAEVLISRLAPRLPAIACWTLAILIGVQAALMVRDLLPQPAASAAITGGASRPNSTAARVTDIQRILDAHLFGVATEGPAQSNPAEAPETRLSLVLAGTIASSDPAQGLAIIGESPTTAKVYSVGDSVAGGARLHAVYGDRAILERNGQLEALLLPREYKGSDAAAAAPMTSAAAATPASELADRMRRMIAQDPGSVSEIMRPQPVFANGQQRGYRVYPGRDRQQFARLGLKPGDLVTSINGTPLDDPQRGMEIFRSIGSADSVRVTIERNGKPTDIVLNMAQIANELPPDAGNTNDGMVPMDQTEPMPPDPTEPE